MAQPQVLATVLAFTFVVFVASTQQACASGQVRAPNQSPAQAGANLAPVPVAEPAGGELLTKIARHKSYARPTVFEEASDGFVADGRQWLDPEGSILWHGANQATGDVTYLVSQGTADFIVKFANVHSPDAPVVVGQLTAVNGQWRFVGVDGTELRGEQVIPLADGLVATRGAAYFRYQFGQQPTAHTLPPEYAVLYAQRGDVAGTGFILAVKKSRQTMGDQLSLAASKSQPRKAPTIFGKRDPDFALIDTNSDRLVVLPRSEATTELSMKYRFKEDGSKNDISVFNVFDWQQTSIGPIALVFADDSSSLYAINLTTEERVTLFKRGLGINDWSAEPTADGGLRVSAQLGFKHERQPDVRSLFVRPEPSAVPQPD